MQFYIYVSDAKVDMLLAQIPPRRLKRLAAEVTVDLKLLSVRVSTRDAPETRWSRAEVVTRYLYDKGMIGELRGNRQFFAVQDLPMRWGVVGGWNGQVVFFASQDEQCRLFLTGAPHHVIGTAPGVVVDVHNSLCSWQQPLDAAAHVFGTWERDGSIDADYPTGVASTFGDSLLTNYSQRERLALVARRITEKEKDGRREIFGSPV